MLLTGWTDAFSVNLVRFDLQHQKLFALAHELHEARRTGRGRDIIQQVVDELVAYTETHFGAEEKLMSTYGFPGLATHRQEHEEFIKEVTKFRETFRQGNAFITLDVMLFIQNWLVKHIQGTDKQYSAFFTEKGLR